MTGDAGMLLDSQDVFGRRDLLLGAVQPLPDSALPDPDQVGELRLPARDLDCSHNSDFAHSRTVLPSECKRKLSGVNNTTTVVCHTTPPGLMLPWGVKREFDMKFGERLKKAREHAGLNQPELAIKAGVSQKTVSKLELGNQAKSSKTEELAKACGVRYEWLLRGKGDMLEVEQEEGQEQMRDEMTETIASIAAKLPAPKRKLLLEAALDIWASPADKRG